MNEKQSGSSNGEIMLIAIGGIDETLIKEALGHKRKSVFYRLMPIAAALLALALCIAPFLGIIGGVLTDIYNEKNDNPTLPGFDFSQGSTDEGKANGALRGDTYLRIMTEKTKQSSDLLLAASLEKNEIFFPARDGKIYLMAELVLKIEGAEYTFDGSYYEIVSGENFKVTAGENTLSFELKSDGYLIKLS